MATILKTDAHCTAYLDPSGPIHSSFKERVDSYQWIRAFLNVDLFALIRDLANAAQPLRASFSRWNHESALNHVVKEIIEIWQRYGKSFSVSISENDGFVLLEWATSSKAIDMVTALFTLYASYSKSYIRLKNYLHICKMMCQRRGTAKLGTEPVRYDSAAQRNTSAAN
ncbi:uncharacterized protein EKO05_0010572 [Ascochyta rabiei]|uniref:Uncharacterized protein n=1 Tax=Didymella rabiei TaxID=5454 RepID=A0A163AG56_DIDRA|nr:uncharacterized protein EKO05_0010572 [Ascochyta rabiei]KZM21169.1 hypothetical protein ST47_g7690 [Ascochyta rabiei]UPX20337.1 hypothetical protein EKO05_0010572 [Ascochyta rabiei]